PYRPRHSRHEHGVPSRSMTPCAFAEGIREREDGHEGKAYAPVGAEPLTLTEVAEHISWVTGRRIRYVETARAAGPPVARRAIRLRVSRPCPTSERETRPGHVPDPRLDVGVWWRSRTAVCRSAGGDNPGLRRSLWCALAVGDAQCDGERERAGQ